MDKILLKDIYETTWDNQLEEKNNDFLKTIKEDSILFSIFKGKMINPLNIEITIFEEWKNKMKINSEPDIKNISNLLSSYSSLLSNISNLYIKLNLYGKKFEQAEEYYQSLLNSELEKKIIENIKNYYDILKNEKNKFSEEIELNKKYEKLKQDYLKTNLENIENKYNTLIDLEKKKISTFHMDSNIKKDFIINEFKRKKEIIEFSKLYFSDCNKIFNEYINSLKKIISIYEILYKNTGVM